jgi:hypothetical protein
MSGVYNITINQGATFQKTLIYKDHLGAPVDLTDVIDARAQLRPVANSVTFVEFDVEVDAVPTSGKIHWSMSATNTASITAPFTQVYDLEIEYLDGTVKRLLQGSATISPEVTKNVV